MVTLPAVTATQMWRSRDTEVDPSRNPVLRAMRRIVPMTGEQHGQKMTVREGGKLLATPLLAVLVVIETTDVLFAVDSIPAILAVTRDPFLVFTSNAFAILGLRALYFLLAGMIDRFAYLKLGLAAVLVFVGAKMLLADVYKLPIWLSLAVIATTIAVSVMASLRRRQGEGTPDEPPRERMVA
jgi:tellurite resistance protein TerC